MPLKDTHVRNAKPTGKAYKISDGDGMYLLVVPSGSRYWRLDYRFANSERYSIPFCPCSGLNASSRRKARPTRDSRQANAQQADIVEIFPDHEIGDVGDLGVEA